MNQKKLFDRHKKSIHKPSKKIGDELSPQDAYELANVLKEEIRSGEISNADSVRIQKIVAGLSDSRGLIRRTFSESLGLIGNKAVPALRETLLKHSNVIARRAAAKTLKLVGEPSALPDLLSALLNDPDPVVQCSAVGAIAIFGPPAVELLLKVFVDPKSTEMQKGLASWGLSFVGAEAPEALRAAAKSTQPQIKAAAIAALGDQIENLNDEKAKALLLKALDDNSSEVRAEAVALLGKINQKEWSQPLLTEKLSDPNKQVRKNAALSLMKLNDLNSIDALNSRNLIEEDKDVSRILSLSINQITLNNLELST